MIVADIARALTLYYEKALNDGGRPIGSSWRYVGNTIWECCTPGPDGKALGTLRVSMAGMGPSVTPPNRQIQWGTCAVQHIIEWNVRVVRCWPADEKSTPEQFDAHAAGILDDAWILAGSSVALVTHTELLEQLCGGSLGCKMGAYSLTPILPQGGCAGNMVTVMSSARGPHSMVS